MTIGKVGSRIARYALVIGFCFLAVFPLYWMFVTSVSNEDEMYSSRPPLLPTRVLGEGLADLFEAGDIGRWLVNTMAVASGTSVITVCIAVLGGYSLSRFRFKGAGVTGLLLLATQMLPEALIVVPVYVIFRALGLLNSLFALVLINSAFTVPIGVWILKGYFDTIPVEIEDAALVDGCSRLQALGRIILPNALPAVVAVAVIVFFEAWNEYLFASTLITSQSRWVTSVGLASFIGMFTVPIQQMMAGALVFTLPALLFYAFLQRFIISGLTSGAVKG